MRRDRRNLLVWEDGDRFGYYVHEREYKYYL